MQNKHILISGGMAAGLCAFLIAGCASPSKSDTASSEPNGSRLWAQNCIRCHNLRSPTTYSQEQWEVTMMHMRIRANLTAEQHKAILEYIKSAN